MVHVLAVDCSSYAEVVGSKASSAILAGCVCSSCGGTCLELTDCWVRRGRQSRGGAYEQVLLRLARCLQCGARERILPSDLLPGKVNDVGNIFSAVAAALAGQPLEAVAEAHGVSRQCVSKWACGVQHRALDLQVLHRHRAMIAEPGSSGPHLLVPLASFVAEAQSRTGAPAAPPSSTIARPDVSGERTRVVGDLLGVLGDLGGALAAAMLGAELFRQAVLLFRGGGSNTSSCIFSGAPFCDGVLDGIQAQASRPP